MEEPLINPMPFIAICYGVAFVILGTMFVWLRHKHRKLVSMTQLAKERTSHG
jgi:hypothetical protein